MSQQHSKSGSSISGNKHRKINEQKRQRRIFLVDDEQDILSALKIGLEETGLFEVDTFVDPKAALSNFFKAGLNYYDLLLIDIKMPQVNGFEIYQQIKNKFGAIGEEAGKHKGENSNGSSSRTPKVCFITAYEIYYETLKKEFPTLNTVGCFIKKPIEIKELVNRIKQELELDNSYNSN